MADGGRKNAKHGAMQAHIELVKGGLSDDEWAAEITRRMMNRKPKSPLNGTVCADAVLATVISRDSA
jgi:hypothetical protein